MMVVRSKILRLVELHTQGNVDLALLFTHASSIGSRVGLRIAEERAEDQGA